MSPRPVVSRRSLVRPHRAGGGVRATQAERGAILRASRPMMGTTFEVRLPANVPGASDLACRALDRVEAIEAQMTIYRDDSEVALLNASAHREPVAVEPGLFALLERAAEIGLRTGGAYDVASGALSLAWGFTRGPRRVPSGEALADALGRSGMRHVRLDPTAQTVAFDREGVAINLGSIGKGFALDEAARVVRDFWWPTPALIHGGQSSVYAVGSPPDAPLGRWAVGLRNPFDPTRPLGRIYLRDRGLGTSGDSFQQFEAGGRLYGHIIDPRTGVPPEGGPASVSVLAPTAAEADALSTAFHLMGPGAAREFLADRPDVGAIFVLPGDDRRPPRMVRIGVRSYEYQAEPGVHLAQADR